MKRLTLALALAPMLGCFPTLHEIQQSCAQRFEPQASKELYMHCVSTEADDVRSQQQQLANAVNGAVGSAYKHLRLLPNPKAFTFILLRSAKVTKPWPANARHPLTKHLAYFIELDAFEWITEEPWPAGHALNCVYFFAHPGTWDPL